MKKLKDTYYFTHDSNARNDEKILNMRAVYGYEGYGLYWAIIEMLRDATDNKLNINCVNALSIALNYDSKKLKVFIEDCINNFQLLVLNEDKYHSNRLLRNVKKYKQISSKRSAIAKQMHSNKTKLKEIKEKEKKVNKSKKVFFPCYPTELQKYIKEDVWNEWLLHRKNIKAELTELSYKKEIKFLLAQPNPTECIETSIRNNWRGLFEVKTFGSNGHHKPKDLEPEKF